MAAALAVLIVLVGLAVVELGDWSISALDQEAAFQVWLPEWHFPGANYPPSFALSPDGGQLVYLGRGEADGSTRLYSKGIDDLAPRALPGTESAYPEDASWAIVFSPDSEWLAFTKGRRLWKMNAAATDGPLPFCDLPEGSIRGASWGDDGTIVFGRFGSGLVEIGTRGECAQRTLTDPDQATSEQHYWPQALPGGDYVLFNASAEGESWNDADIAVVSRVTGKISTLGVNGAHPRYVPTGHLLFARRGVLYAVPFNVDGMEVTGAETPVLSDLTMASGGRGAVQLSVSDAGTLAWVSSSAVGREVVLVDRQERQEVLDLAPAAYSRPRFSANGERLALIDGSDLLVYELGSHRVIPVTDGEPAADIPLWLPGGEGLMFSSDVEGPINLFTTALYRDGSAERLLPKTPNIQYATSMSPDGRTVLMQEQSGDTDWDIFAVDVDGDRRSRVLVGSAGADTGAVFSPDGRYFAYTSYENGRYEVYVRSVDNPEARRDQVSVAGGTHPVWRGSEIFYLQDDTILAVEVATESNLAVGAARPLMEVPFMHRGQGRYPAYYDVSPDGQRFAFVRASEQPPPRTLNVRLHWFAELQRLVPSGRLQSAGMVGQ